MGPNTSTRVRLGLVSTLLVLAASSGAGAQAAGVHNDQLLAPAATCPGSTAARAPDAVQLRAMACLLQFARSQLGLPRLRESQVLDRAASLKIDGDLQCGAFSHTPCGKPFQAVFAAAGFPLSGSYSIGENLGFGQGALGSPEQIMSAWLNSPDHRANIVSPEWKSFGLDLKTNASFLGYGRVTLWANEFANP